MPINKPRSFAGSAPGFEEPLNLTIRNRRLAKPRRSTTDRSRLTKFDNTANQQQPSTSKLISQSQDTTNRAVPVQGYQPISSAAVKRELKQDADMYRALAKKTKHERPINPKLEIKMIDLRKELHNKALEAPGRELRNIADSIRYTEDQRDAYAFRKLTGKK